MKIGNISRAVLKRSVLNQLHSRREEVFLGPNEVETCAGIGLEDADAVILGTAMVYGDEKDLGYYGIAKAVNDVATRGGEPIGVEITIQLPPFAYESRLKAMVGHIEQCCEAHQLQVLGVKAGVNPVIRSSIVSVVGVGSATKAQSVTKVEPVAEMDIVLLGTVGTEGGLRILNMKETEIGKRFIPRFFDALRETKGALIAIEPIKEIIKYGAVTVLQLGESGILAGLWDIGEAAGVGLEVDIKKISIRQDVIEVCEFAGVNPYQLTSTGSVLCIVKEGQALVERLKEMGYPSGVIGTTTSQKEKILYNGEEKRFLDRPTEGELGNLFPIEERNTYD